MGYLGNAAAGVIFPITVVGWGLSLFFGDGAASALSVSLGKGRTQEIHRSVGGAVLCSFLSGVVAAAIAYLWGDGLLRLIGATDANLQMAHEYGVIIFAMMPLAMTQNTLASIIRADGSPSYAMAAILRDALLIVFSQLLPLFFGVTGIFWAAPAADVLAIAVTAPVMRRLRKSW